MTNYGYAKIIGKTKKSIFCLSLFCDIVVHVHKIELLTSLRLTNPHLATHMAKKGKIMIEPTEKQHTKPETNVGNTNTWSLLVEDKLSFFVKSLSGESKST